MPNKYESTCALCAKPILRSSKSRPAGRAMCRACYLADRESRIEHGGRRAYDRGCRCEVCRAGQSARNKRWRERTRALEPVRFTRSCEACGESFEPATKLHRACSIRCRILIKNAKQKADRRAATARSVNCAVCGETFDRFGNQKMCSEACRRKRATQHTLDRKAKVIGTFMAPVDRAAIFERDKWRCYRCGCRLSKTKTVPHLQAPTLDHLIPVTRGGTHEPANVMACCYSCNCRKGNRGGNEQLLLVG